MLSEISGVSVAQHKPEKKNIALVCDQPWEGVHNGYASIVKVGDTYRLYYRAWGQNGLVYKDEKAVNKSVICLAESKDGITFKKPDLNKYDELFEDTLPEDAGGDRIDNRTWGKIVLETEKLFPPLIGQLTGSAARIEGGTIYIKLGEKNLKVFVKEEILGNFVAKAAFTVLGKTYKIKLD